MKYSYSSINRSFHNQEAWINVLFFKYITVPMVYLIVNYTRITPNIISIISLVFGVASAFYYFLGGTITAAFLYLISYLFDAIDGKVARITKTGKVYGAWMDIFVDRFNLTLISTGIAYHHYLTNDNIKLLLLNSIFLGLVFIGTESRHYIDMHKEKNSVQDEEPKSKFKKWCKEKGLLNEPISLVEIIIFYLILAPQLKIELYSCMVIIVLLVLRILKQQLYMVHVTRSK